MQKGSAQILFLLFTAVVVLGGGYLYFNKSDSPQPKLTNPLIVIKNKVYTNSQLGFEFSYEPNLTVKEDTEEEFDKRGNGTFRKNFKGYVFYEPGEFLGASVVLDDEGSYESSPLTVWVFDNPENLSIDSWDKKYWYYPFVWGDFTSRRFESAPVNEATISGKLAKFGVVDYQPGKPKFVYLSKDTKMYLFRIIGDEGEKILGTFKFI